MTQQIINLGVGPDTQTGDSLFTAFNKVNDNFGELYTVFGSNSITTINANVVLANSITISSNVRSGNLFAYGNLETIGYVIAAGVFYPNGVPIGGSGQIDSNLIPTTSNIYSVGNVSNQFTEGYFSSNITLSGANVTVRNSQLLVNGQFVSGNYGNSNVAQYLPVYGGNIAATITTASQPYITSVGTLTGLNVIGNTSISGNLDVSGTITYLNVRDFSVQDPIVTLNTGPNGAPLVSNNSFDSGVRTYYYDGQNKASFFGRTNSTGYFEYFSNVISETGNIITGTYGTIKTANLILTAAANIAGNVTGNYFLGNGRFLTGIDATSIQNGNSNVKVYENGNVSVTTAGTNTWNFGTAGQLTVPGAILTASASKLDLVGFGPNTAYLTTTADDSTALFMGAAVVDLRALDSISIATNTDDTSYLWTFAADGNLTLPGNLNVAGFNVINSNGNVVTSSLENSGVIAGTYGNASSVPSITVDSKGRVTAISNVAVAGVSNVSYNNTTGNLTVSTSSGTNYVVDLGVGTADSPIFSGLSISGNTAVNALTINNSATIGSTLSVTGNLIAGNLNATNFIGNAITLGTNTAGQLVSNAVTLTSSTSITNSIAQINFVLGKLVPTAPNNFPGGQSLTISTLSTYRMCNFVQTDNTTGANKSVAGGTSISNVRRVTTYTTSTIANVGPGDIGTVTSYRNGVAVGNVTLIAGNSSGTYGNLVITRSGDYANVSSITPGFWYSFSSSLNGNVAPGWNEVYIVHSGAGAGTNTPYWYYDASAPGTPTWSNTSISLTTNSSTYSSTIPHLNSSSQFTLYGNVSKLSGDMFPSGASSSAYAFVTGTAGGAIAAPSSVTYAGAGVTWPLTPNLYVSSGSAYLTTTAAVISGFGSSSLGPTLTADNSYITGGTTFNPGVTVLYKTGTSTQIEETSITVTSVGTGSGNALRVINPGSTDTPTITANTAFNSQTSTLQTYDATVVAATLKHDQTNYSTGYLPVGPNLSAGRTGPQYFTFRFTRTAVSKFNVSVTGNVGNVWVALPGSTIDNASTLNGWIDLGTAYSGSGVPGANVSAGGNGSNGCAVGGVFVSNSSGTQSKTCTFGTVSSSSTVSNEIFVRLKLYSGQTVTALSIVTATN